MTTMALQSSVNLLNGITALVVAPVIDLDHRHYVIDKTHQHNAKDNDKEQNLVVGILK